jgi:hypothetical protein
MHILRMAGPGGLLMKMWILACPWAQSDPAINNRGFRITGINEEMTQTLTTVIIISNPNKKVFFEIL